MGSTIDVLKELQTPTTPLFLIDCVLSSGATESWGTHAAAFNGTAYTARLLAKHTLFQLTASSSDGLDGAAQIALTLANADSHFFGDRARNGIQGRAGHDPIFVLRFCGQSAGIGSSSHSTAGSLIRRTKLRRRHFA